MIKEKRSVFLFMEESILEQLENVPYDGEDAYNELVGILENNYGEVEKLQDMTGLFLYREKERINYELKKIKEWGIAKIFLFGLSLSPCLEIDKVKKCLVNRPKVKLGLENYSYINELLHITNINPVKYNLPFERFFNEHRKFLPTFNVYVEKGDKGKRLKYLYETYGKNLFIKPKDSDDIYYTSGKPFDRELVKETIIVAKENEEVYEENISILTSRELSKLGFYSFSITEVEKIEYLDDTKITEQTILEKKKELFDDCYRSSVEEFELIEEVKPYLSYTENKLIYQEQFMEICNKVLGVSYSMADYYRRELAKKKKDNLNPLKEIIMQKFHENGEKLFDYFCNVVPYSVSKAYIIACLLYKIEE